GPRRGGLRARRASGFAGSCMASLAMALVGAQLLELWVPFCQRRPKEDVKGIPQSRRIVGVGPHESESLTNRIARLRATLELLEELVIASCQQVARHVHNFF